MHLVLHMLQFLMHLFLGKEMKTTLLFRDQIQVLVNWFDCWNSCEQTVAVYTMCRKLKPGQIRFLSNVLQQLDADNQEIQYKDAQANNAG